MTPVTGVLPGKDPCLFLIRNHLDMNCRHGTFSSFSEEE